MEKHVYDRESSFGKRHSNANKKMCNMDDDGEDEDDSKEKLVRGKATQYVEEELWSPRPQPPPPPISLGTKDQLGSNVQPHWDMLK